MGDKLNCWQYKNCGRESGGKNAEQMGICPVTQEKKLNGIHQGKNAGRCCWIVAGSLCKGEIQGTFALKYKNCEKCDFYLKVREEEFPQYKYSITLLKLLESKK